MRILFVHERLGSLGGAEANACITGAELQAKGHVTGLAHGPYTGKGEANWKKAFSSFFPIDQSSPRRAIETAIQQFKPDVVYVHKIADLDILEALVESGLPLVRMVHDHDIYCMRSYKYFYGSRKICDRPASSYCVFPCGAVISRNHGPGLPIKFNSLKQKYKEIQLNQRFNRMLVVTDFMRGELLKNGFNSENIEIHPPVPKNLSVPLRSNFSNRNLIVYAGQIIRGKGVDMLLRSLALVKTPFECIILGDGSHKAYCEKLSKDLGIADRVKFEGFVPQEQLQSYYKECTLFAISSVWPEPIATVGLEVMRFGLPIVAFDAGGIKDWLTDGYNGYLVPWMDVKKYASRMEELLNNKQLAKSLGENGLEFVSKHYEFDSYISGLETMFRQVVSETKKAITDGQPESEDLPVMA
ncbi:MAG: glycosyltransferase family 4 protein [Verrucomicrobiales bacterium]